MARSTLLRIPDSLPVPLPLRRLLAVSVVALATANCSTNPQKFSGPAGNGLDPKYGVKTSPRLYNEGDVIPKGGGRRFSGKPYVVAGRTYVPKEDARGYVREGLASWYGAAFHGRMTANGEVFDRHSIAAAHPTLPLPSYVRVTNVANGYSMVVRVNDRGPYHADRVMDVSEEVARALEFHNKGTARVRVAYLGKASVAGSDDRKLLATLRTDGSPAGTRAPVMVADLGASEEPERYERPARAPLAFKPAEEREDAPAPRPAPVVLAAATVKVPAAVQPTVARVKGFAPAPVQARSNLAERPGPARMPGAKPGETGRAEPIRLAARSAHSAEIRSSTKSVASNSVATQQVTTRVAPAPNAMSPSAKLTMARLAMAAVSGGGGSTRIGAKGGGEAAVKQPRISGPADRGMRRLAEIY